MAKKKGSAGVAKKKGGRRRTARQSAKDIERMENQKAALDYRRQGYSYRQIADALSAPVELDEDGVNIGGLGRLVPVSTVYEWVTSAIKALIPDETVQDARKSEIDKLESLWQPLFVAFVQGATGKDVLDQLLKIQDRKARFLGLYKSGDSMAELGGQFGAGAIDVIRADAPVYLRPDEPLPKRPIP